MSRGIGHLVSPIFRIASRRAVTFYRETATSLRFLFSEAIFALIFVARSRDDRAVLLISGERRGKTR